jgi:YegS/Rv2252/BmrU family lipid kinase
MNLLFVVNPVAGKGKTKDAVPLIEKYCRNKEIPYKIAETKRSGDATEIVRRECQAGYTAVVAVGGDGTVLEAANGLVGTDIPLGIIPLGSGNDFSRAMNVPSGLDNIERALQIITELPARTVDLARFNGRVFLNIASIGFDAEIIRDLHQVKKFIKGSTAYPVSVFLKFLTYKPKDVTLLIDGNSVSGKTFLAAVCNGICYGGGMKVNPKGSVTDGYFDVILIKPLPRYKIPFLLLKFIKGEHLNLPYVTTYRCKEVQIQSNGGETAPLAINVDGECAMMTPVVFKLMPLSIHVFGDI